MSAWEAAGPFGAFHHIGIATNDLDATAENIRALVDGRIIERGTEESLGMEWVWIEAAGTPIFEVVAARGEGPIADFLSRHGPGLHHLSFRPLGLDASLEHVRHCRLGIVGENRDHSGFEEFFVDPKLTGGALFHSFIELAAE